jgi:hypothetical protein
MKQTIVLMICFCLPLPAWADGMGFKLGQVWIDQKEFMTPYEGPLQYWDFHFGAGVRIGVGALILDLSLANYGGDGKETLFSGDDIVAMHPKVIHGLYAERKDVLTTEDSRATLSVWGALGHLRYELSTPSFLKKIPIVSNLRPYAGVGLGYLWKAEYNIETDYTKKDDYGKIVSDHFYTDFSGSSFATQIVAGVVLFAKSPVSLRLEYQKLQSMLMLSSSEGNLNKQLPIGGQAGVFEIILNL